MVIAWILIPIMKFNKLGSVPDFVILFYFSSDLLAFYICEAVLDKCKFGSISSGKSLHLFIASIQSSIVFFFSKPKTYEFTLFFSWKENYFPSGSGFSKALVSEFLT